MTRWEQSWATEMLAAFAPQSPDGLAPLPGEVDYQNTLRRMLRGSTPLAALGLRLSVWLVALAPIWLLGRCVTFSKLALREQSELLGRLLRHRSLGVRELVMLLKLTAAIALLGTPSVRARSGYDSVAKPPVIAIASVLPAKRHLVLEAASGATGAIHPSDAPPEKAAS